jgi:subtilisin family serine protease
MRQHSTWHSAAVILVVASLVVGTALSAVGATEVSAAAAEGRHILVSRASTGVPDDLARRISAVGGTVEAVHPSIGVVIVTGLTAAAAVSLANAPDIGAIVPDATVTGPTPVSREEPVAGTDVSTHSPTNPTTATFFARQWHLRAIGAERAWAAGRLGSPTVTVAILDTGIDYSHRDLEGRVDLSRSKSFVASDDVLVRDRFPGKHPITDLHYHGTHVAATVSSNARSAAGVTSQVTLIGVKVLDSTARGPLSRILAGLMYAADSGAAVINLSLGGDFDKDGRGQVVALLNRAVTYAHRQGATVVVSAGNDAIDLDHDGNSYKYLCNSPTVSCVAATGPTSAGGVNGPFVGIDTPASYSNSGRSAISVAAPGGYGRPGAPTVWAACSRTSLALPVCQTGTFVVGLAGTSMAAPHTAGLAALLVEKHGKNPGRIHSALRQSADDLGQRGTDPAYGKGRINVARALGLP